MTGVFDQSLNRQLPISFWKRFAVGMFLSVALFGAASGCVEELPALAGTNSFKVSLSGPSTLGKKNARLVAPLPETQIAVRAIGMNGELDSSFSGSVQVLVHYLGSIGVPGDRGRSLASVKLENGEGTATLDTMPKVFGPTVLWVDDAHSEEPTHAAGTSETIWFRDPFLSDISTPNREESSTALSRSPLETKLARVTESRYGDKGRLVVTGVYPEGYTVSDVQCQDAAGTPPCVAGDYDHLYVFAFGSAEYEGGGELEVGHSISAVSGPISEFNGLTELSFPQTYATDQVARIEQLPEPVKINGASLAKPIVLERLEAALISIEDGEVCPLDKNYQNFGQWKVDIGDGCSKGVAVISKGVVSGFDPAQFVGRKIPKIVGTLRPINFGTFNVWLMYPRNRADLVLP